MRKNSFFSKTSIIVVLVTNRERPFDYFHRRVFGIKKKKENSREESFQSIHKPHNLRIITFEYICSLNIQLIFIFYYPFFSGENAAWKHYLKEQSRKDIQMRQKNKGKTKKERKKDKRNVYYMLQGGLLLWLKLDSRWSCYCVDFNAFTYKWQRKGENCENKRILRHRKYRMAFSIVESSKNSLEKKSVFAT